MQKKKGMQDDVYIPLIAHPYIISYLRSKKCLKTLMIKIGISYLHCTFTW
jgi:hypothetical protein